VPGSTAIGALRIAFAQLSWVARAALSIVSASCPIVIVSAWRTRSPARWSLASDGASSGRRSITRSSTESKPSLTANPTAVEVKLLLSEYIEWVRSGE
jgi:hypothetical protein